MNVPEDLGNVLAIEGKQQNLIIPITFDYKKKAGPVGLGVLAGGFFGTQLGTGFSKVFYLSEPPKNYQNCSTSSDKFIYGIVAGLSAVITEKHGFSFFTNARWYQSLINNAAYSVAESGVKMNTGILAVGISHDLPF